MASVDGHHAGHLDIWPDGGIWSFRTMPEYRGCGIMLLKEAIRIIKERGQTPYLFADAGAIRFYLRMGFTQDEKIELLGMPRMEYRL